MVITTYYFMGNFYKPVVCVCVICTFIIIVEKLEDIDKQEKCHLKSQYFCKYTSHIPCKYTYMLYI